jgi:transcriptional regulator with XRE-family HTH domain
MADKSHIGKKIKQLRTDRQLSVEELAENSNLSVDLLTKLESGQLASSLTPLLKIARGLGVRLGTFLDDMPQQGPVFVKGGHSEKIISFTGKTDQTRKSNLDFFSLAADKQDRHMEPFIVNVRNMKTDEHKLSSHEGEEFIYVLEGNIEIIYGKETYELAAGDSIYYDSIVPHDLHAVGDEDAKILGVIYSPF